MDNQKNKIVQIILLLLLSQFTSQCQKMKKIPQFHTEICSPNPKYRIVPIYDYIKTLEKTPAGLPYGSSSGNWGSSGSMWSEQHGTPIGFDITYYATYENKYYHIDANFDLAYMTDRMDRCYAGNDQDSQTPVKEYVYSDELQEIRRKNDVDRSYDPIGDLVFGFAPQGMVVVWLRYGGANCFEIGRYQAIEVTDEQKIAQYRKKYESKYRLEGDSYQVQVQDMHMDNPSCKPWDNYRIKYNWNYEVTSENKAFRLLSFASEYYNGEKESSFRPIVLKPEMKKRGIPEIINIYFETSATERYIGRFFFNWDKINELLKKSGTQNTFKFIVSPDNSKIDILLNNQKIEVDSVRIYPDSHMRFRESYQE